jgi:hypothetical protein
MTSQNTHFKSILNILSGWWNVIYAIMATATTKYANLTLPIPTLYNSYKQILISN